MVDNSGTSALIAGGTQGLGMAVAECLIRQGCKMLTITGRSPDRGEATAAQLRDAGADCCSLPATPPTRQIARRPSLPPLIITAMSARWSIQLPIHLAAA